jgi:hypothetical protein
MRNKHFKLRSIALCKRKIICILRLITEQNPDCEEALTYVKNLTAMRVICIQLLRQSHYFPYSENNYPHYSHIH